MVTDAGIKSSISDLVTRLLDFLNGHNWSVVMPDGSSSTSFLIRPDQIETFLAIIPQQLAKGNIVELGDFGSYWLKTTSEGAASVDEVRANQIVSILPRFNPGRKFKDVLKTIEYVKGTVVSEPAPEPVVE